MSRLLPLLALLLAGCALGPDYRRPKVEAPPRFAGQARQEAASLADQPWWDVFADPVLKDLQAEALGNNFEVHTATWRVAEFRARAGITRAAWFPAIAPEAQWYRGRTSTYAVPGNFIGNAYDVHAGVSWELDLWGRIRRLNEAALADYLGAQNARRGVFLTTLSQVASGYFELRELDQRLAIARSTVAAFQGTSDLFGRRLAGGAASALETARAQAALASARAAVPNLERQIQAQENLLAVLVGRAPGPIARGADLEAQPLPPEIPAGLPSALLERRPDLREAEERLVAANAAVGVAKANYFPALSLTGMFGGLSPEANQLTGTGREWLAGAALTGPLFQGARLKHQKAAAVAQWEQAREHYREAVTGAFGEVATALVAYQKLAEVEKEQAAAVAALQQAVVLANLRYDAGLSNYLEVLDAQEQLYPAQNARAQTRLARLQTLVQLYKALGGGWNLEDAAMPPKAAAQH